MKLAPAVGVMLAVIVALLLARECGRREGAATALAAQRDRRDDSTVARLAYEVAKAEKQLQRERDSTGRVIRALRAKTATHGSTALQLPESVTDSIAIARQLAMRDSVIAAYDAGRQQDSLALLFWQRQVAQRDTLVAQLQTARNAWRSSAQRRLACVGGPSVAVGLNGQGAVGIGVTCGYRL